MTPSTFHLLIQMATEPLLPAACLGDSIDELPDDLVELLRLSNGFYAFGGALLVRPTCGHEPPGHGIPEPTLDEWNSRSSWRRSYHSLVPKAARFFAEDVFGAQFAEVRGAVLAFDPETGEFTESWPSLSAWIEQVVADPDVLVGRSIAADWGRVRGAVPRNHRLVPVIPFVLGGAFDIGNLFAEVTLTSMIRRSELAHQLLGLPDGTQVGLSITD